MPLVTLPWPHANLSQNSRAHRHAVAKSTKAARWDAKCSALEAGIRKPGWGAARLTVTIRPPDRKRRDVANVAASMKAYIDGIADAIGIDDSRFQIVWPVSFAEPVKRGSVTIEIAPLEVVA